MTSFFAVAFGGALGAVCRFGLSALIAARGFAFPYHTLAVNMAGCFLMGILSEAAAARLIESAELRLFLMVGFLGAFTTFSTFTLDLGALMEREEFLKAFTYAAASVILCIALFFTGAALTLALRR